jgi:photosystem II stability/assembly factor-like uncharacterized protein
MRTLAMTRDRAGEPRRRAAALLLAGLAACASAPPLAAAAVQDDGLRWQTLGPFAAAVLALAVDPADPANVYAATSGGAEVWKSADGGATWSGLHQGEPRYGDAKALAIDPRHPSIIYLADYFRGVFKSIDGGTSWSQAGLVLPNPSRSTLRSLAIDPRHPRTLYAGGSDGVFKTINGGATWELARRGLPAGEDVFALAVDPSAPRTLYAGVGSYAPSSNKVGVWKSTNGGATWAPAGSASPASSVFALAIDPHSPQVVYAGGDNGLLKSADGGTSWRRADHGLRRFGTIQAVALDATSPRTLFAVAGGAVFKSIDAGASWAAANQGLEGFRVFSLALDPSGSGAAYAGTLRDGQLSGVWKSSDGGASWSARDQGGLTTFGFTSIAESPRGTIYVSADGAQGFDLFVSGDGGLTWATVAPRSSAEIFQLVVDPLDPATLYGVGYQGLQFSLLLRSRDGGASWELVPTTFLNVNFVAIDPQDDAIIYAALDDRELLRSADGGRSWTPATGGDPPRTLLRQVVIDPVSPSNVYAFGWAADELFRSLDRGLSWARLGSSQGGISALVVDPLGSGTLFAVAAGSIEKSVDRGATWSVVYVPPDPVHAGVSAIAIAPTTPATVYAAVPELGLLRSADGGTTWELVPAAGLGAFVQQLQVDTLNPRRLIAGIFEGGLQALTVPAP